MNDYFRRKSPIIFDGNLDRINSQKRNSKHTTYCTLSLDSPLRLRIVKKGLYTKQLIVPYFDS